MTRNYRTGRVALVAVLLALLFSGWSFAAENSSGVTAEGGGGGTVNNEVVVINLHDGRFVSRTGFGTARVTGESAYNQNAAAAVSSCIDCRTVAVAIQIVLIQRTDASTIAPTNYAIALNQSCTGCETFATAYQYVVTTDGIVHFTAEGNRRLAELEKEIRDLAGTDGIPLTELNAQINSLVQEMWSVVDNELVLAGANGTRTGSQDVAMAIDSPTATPTPTAVETTTPAPVTSESATEPESPTPTPSDEPTAQESPAPSESPSESPAPSSSP